MEHSKVDEASTITNELTDGPTAQVVAARKPIRVCRFCADPDCDNPLFCQSYEPSSDSSTVETALMEGMEEEASALVRDMWGNALFSQHTLLVIEVEGVASSFVLHGAERILLGRADGQQRHAQFLDLTPYKAHIQGVSREHAAISQSGHTLMLTDLGSTNGTFLNEQRLVPNQPRILRDGDMIRLGHLVAYVRFR